jgi:ParB-like chromosome segregation protein Spo0J
LTDGQISLDNGVHRWAVAAELGIKRVPVEMIYQSPEPAWEWSWR